MAVCTVNGCNKPHVAKGLCNKHYIQVQKHGSIVEKPILQGDKRCSVASCNNMCVAKNMCEKHYVHMRLQIPSVRERRRERMKIYGPKYRKDYMSRPGNRDSHKKYMKNYHRNTYNNLEILLRHRLHAAKANAKKRSLPFKIDLPYIISLWEKQAGKCAVSDLPMCVGYEDSYDGALSTYAPFRPSIDRIKPKLGYVNGNVRLVVTIINIALSDWGIHPLIKTALAIVEKMKINPIGRNKNA